MMQIVSKETLLHGVNSTIIHKETPKVVHDSSLKLSAEKHRMGRLHILVIIFLLFNTFCDKIQKMSTLTP